jgi:DNA-binding ferritin-like protein
MVKSSLFSTRIDLSIEVREKTISLLNQHLADAIDLYSQTCSIM